MIRMLKVVLAILVLFAAPARAGSGGLGIGLASAVDWGTSLPFLDLMKTARPWIGHGSDEWEVMSNSEMREAGAYDEHGWPTRFPPGVDSIGTLVLVGLPEEAGGAAGRYVLRYEGTGEVSVGLGAANVVYGPNLVEFDYPQGGDMVHIEITSTDPARTGDYVRNITVVRKDRVAAFEAGEVFNPDWLALIDGFEVLRFMDWMHTNDSTLVTWDDRPKPDDANYRRHGVPVEVMVQLANQIGAEPWFNIPHLADDDFARRFAEMVRDQLDPELRAWVEFSNEVWNWQFQQAHWADEVGQSLWSRDPRWIQVYAGRASEVADIWADVYGDEADARLMRVIATQTGWFGLEKQILSAPKWVDLERGRTAPGEHFDAYAITGYFGSHLGRGDWADPVREWIAESKLAAAKDADAQGLVGAARTAHIEAHKFDLAVTRAAAHLAGADGPAEDLHDVPSLIDEAFAYHTDVAAEWGLELVAYEGGTHVVASWEEHDDDELNAFLMHFNYTEEMGVLYRAVLAGWKALDAGVFVGYVGVEDPSIYGSWGHLRHLTDSNPRWDAFVSGLD